MTFFTAISEMRVESTEASLSLKSVLPKAAAFTKGECSLARRRRMSPSEMKPTRSPAALTTGAPLIFFSDRNRRASR